MIYTRFSDIPKFKYGLIQADPPWHFDLYSPSGNGKGASGQYDCMSLQEIKDIPVAEYASGDCLLWLWCTHPMLHRQFEVVDAWGFEVVTSGVWRKVTRNGKMAWGTGYRLRSTSEPYIIAKLGNPPAGPRNIPTCFDGIVRGHSRKPEEGYRYAELMAPEDCFRLELFSREEREGWDVFGDEVGKFEEGYIPPAIEDPEAEPINEDQFSLFPSIL